MTSSFFRPCGVALLMLSGTFGCTKQPAPPAPVAEVTIRPAIEKEVTDTVEFPGRTEAVASVEIRSRVTGYLQTISFTAGADVKEGETLYQIDPRPFQADLERAEGQVTLQEVRAARLKRDVERNTPLVNKGGISQQEFDKMVGERDEAEAAVKAAKANLKGYKQNLEYSTIKAPITGRISRTQITEGNLVKADVTVLATLVSKGDIYVYFNVDENTMLRYDDEVRRGHITPSGKEGLVALTLGDGSMFKGGTIDYRAPEVDKTTGTLEVRARFPDPNKIISGGQFVRVQLPMGNPHKAVVIPEIAVGSDQGSKYVFVVDDKDKVEYRRVTTGSVNNGMQVIVDGLKAGEMVITKGLLRVRDGVTVKPTPDEAK